MERKPSGSRVEVLLDGPLTRNTILGLKTRALRRRVWFRALDRLERGLLDVTIRWVDTVKSGRLAQVLVKILAKLVLALNERMVRIVEEGRGLALRLSRLALGWGNLSALDWRSDLGFQRALGLGVLSRL
jgi:hypothetical protein